MFLDESGDHDLLIKDRQYPVFVLAGCVIEENYYNNIVNSEINNYKIRLFGNAKIILHTADITRNRNGFKALSDKKFRERFYKETNKLMEKLNYTVLACVIKKIEHLQKYSGYAVDPYILSLFCLVERFVYQSLKSTGTRYIKAKYISYWLPNELEFRGKIENINGLQLADLIASPIGRNVIGKVSYEDYRIIEKKFRKYKGEYKGYGLVILPK